MVLHLGPLEVVPLGLGTLFHRSSKGVSGPHSECIKVNPLEGGPSMTPLQNWLQDLWVGKMSRNSIPASRPAVATIA